MGLLGHVVSQAEVGVTDKTEFRLRIEMGGTEIGGMKNYKKDSSANMHVNMPSSGIHQTLILWNMSGFRMPKSS